MAELLLSMQAPGQMRDQRLVCPVTGDLLQIDGNGVIHGLTQEQVDDLFACGYSLTDGNDVMVLRAAASAYAAALALVCTLEAPLAEAIRASRAAGRAEVDIAKVMNDEAKKSKTLLPPPGDIEPLPKAPAAQADAGQPPAPGAAADQAPPPAAAATQKAPAAPPKSGSAAGKGTPKPAAPKG